MRLAEEPLAKITINIFKSDYEYLNHRPGWHTEVRNAIRALVNNKKRKATSVPPSIFPREDSK